MRNERLEFAHWGGDGMYQGFNYALDCAALSPEAKLLYDAHQELVAAHNVDTFDADASTQRLSYVLMCDALLASPEQVMAAIKRLRDDLVAGDPKLALMK